MSFGALEKHVLAFVVDRPCPPSIWANARALPATTAAAVAMAARGPS